jgi:hypothetical protein
VGNAPAAWSLSGLSAVQVKDVSLAGFSNAMYLNNNVYYNGGWNFIGTGYGLQYTADRGAGTYAWNISTASGTAGNPITFTQVMTLDASGNLGIGTSSPAYPLTVAGSTTQLGSDSVAPTLILGKVTPTADGDAGIQFRHTNTKKNWSISSNRYVSAGLEFTPSTTNGGTTYTTPVMVLDTSGNLGLGVTPSAWSASWKAFQFGSVGAAFSNTGNAIWSGNEYLDAAGVPTYITTQYALRYRQDVGSGYHAWFTSASGTAGNTISFTQAMTLDASGNLGVGTTSPSSFGKLAVRGFVNGVSVNASTFNNVSFETSDAVNSSFFVQHGSSIVNLLSDSAMGFYTAISGTVAERVRIDTSGNLLVGTTSATYHTIYKNNANDWAFRVQNPSATAYGMNINLSASPNNTTQEAFRVEDSIASRLVIYSNGNVQNTNNSYGSLSDVKLKENIVDASPKLADLMQVKVRNYNLVGSTTKQIGVVAQELETVFPSMIDVTPDRDAKNNDLGTTTKSVKYSVFVPMLIKAMQEQQAMIESLRQRLSAANL